jgi:hypothetical protein
LLSFFSYFQQHRKLPEMNFSLVHRYYSRSELSYHLRAENGVKCVEQVAIAVQYRVIV